MRRAVSATVLIAALVVAGCGDDSAERDRIRAELDGKRAPEFVRSDADGVKVWAKTKTFYRDTEYAPAWLEGRRASSRLVALVASIKDAERDGLDPALYDAAFLDDHLAASKKGWFTRTRLETGPAAAVEVRATYAYMLLASDLADGISDLAHADPSWHVQRETFDPAAHIAQALSSGRIAESLDTLKPINPEYRVLRDRLAALRAQTAPGPRKTAASDLARSQEIERIALNMERWRWLPRGRHPRHIVVNIPAFRLDVRENDQVVLTMRVVVGKKDTPTPVFNDSMTHVVFSPYWNVPPTIAKGETLPALMRDPTFLARTNMEVLDRRGRVMDADAIDPDRPEDYRFRQRPGADNSLGLVKFMFPNAFNVYLHDTPADSLFARRVRSFSHGCVRLEQPEALAAYVLRDRPEWSAEAISAAMHAGEERTVKLGTPIPVFIGYWTADVTPEGSVETRPDVYGLDARQAASIAKRVASMRRPTTIAARTR
jgi:murein L,D-transpeptidase YcbB/YkuD